MNACELTRLETELKAAILNNSPLVADLFSQYKLAGGYANLKDIEDDVKALNGKRRELQVTS